MALRKRSPSRVADLSAAPGRMNGSCSAANTALRALIKVIEGHSGGRHGPKEEILRGRIAELANLPRMNPRQAASTVRLAEGGGFEPPIRVIPV